MKRPGTLLCPGLLLLLASIRGCKPYEQFDFVCKGAVSSCLPISHTRNGICHSLQRCCVLTLHHVNIFPITICVVSTSSYFPKDFSSRALTQDPLTKLAEACPALYQTLESRALEPDHHPQEMHSGTSHSFQADNPDTSENMCLFHHSLPQT